MGSTSRKTFLGSTAAAGIVVLSRSAARAQTTVTLRIASAPDDDVTPVLYAQQAGLFRDNQLSVDLTHISSGSTATAAVIGGALDVGKASILPVIVAHAKGFPVSVVAPGSLAVSSVPYSGIVVLKDSPYRAARDLDGKVVSVPGLNDLQWLATQAWVDKNGGTSKSMQYIEVPVTTVDVALDTGRIAAGTLSNPTYSQLLQTGKYRSLGRPLDGIGLNLMISVWVTSRDFDSKNPAVVKSFTHAIAEAQAYCNTHHDRTIDLIANYTSIDHSVAAAMPRAVYPRGLDIGAIQPTIDAAVRYGLISKAFNARELFSPNSAIPVT